jgi:hypothetical protein
MRNYGVALKSIDVGRPEIYLTRYYFSDSLNDWVMDGPLRVNDDITDHDQWSPTIAVRPDGWQVFVGFFDRRLDPDNINVHIFGNIYTVALRGDNSLIDNGANFKISDQQFPPVNSNPADTQISDYDTARADNENIYYSWGDRRNVFLRDAAGFLFPVKEQNIRFAKIEW